MISSHGRLRLGGINRSQSRILPVSVRVLLFKPFTGQNGQLIVSECFNIHIFTVLSTSTFFLSWKLINLGNERLVLLPVRPSRKRTEKIILNDRLQT